MNSMLCVGIAQCTVQLPTAATETHLSTALNASKPCLQLPNFCVCLLHLLLSQLQLLLSHLCCCYCCAALLICLLQLLPAVLQLLPAAVELSLQLLCCWPCQAGT
jgi:hypothetical protein